MMKAIFNGGLAILALAAAVHPAAASPVTYTISGTIIGGEDSSSLFGGGSLADKAFTASETFDPAKAQSSWSNAGGSGANGDRSMTGFSFVRAALTIEGVTRRFTDTLSNVYSTAGSQFGSTVKNGVDDLGFYVASGRVKADYMAANGIDGLADFYAGYYDVTNPSGTKVLWANFEVKSLSAVSAVPLPSSAPLFGAGLMMLAAGGYRRRSLKAAASTR